MRKTTLTHRKCRLTWVIVIRIILRAAVCRHHLCPALYGFCAAIVLYALHCFCTLFVPCFAWPLCCTFMLPCSIHVLLCTMHVLICPIRVLLVWPAMSLCLPCMASMLHLRLALHTFAHGYSWLASVLHLRQGWNKFICQSTEGSQALCGMINYPLRSTESHLMLLCIMHSSAKCKPGQGWLLYTNGITVWFLVKKAMRLTEACCLICILTLTFCKIFGQNRPHQLKQNLFVCRESSLEEAVMTNQECVGSAWNLTAAKYITGTSCNPGNNVAYVYLTLLQGMDSSISTSACLYLSKNIFKVTRKGLVCTACLSCSMQWEQDAFNWLCDWAALVYVRVCGYDDKPFWGCPAPCSQNFVLDKCIVWAIHNALHHTFSKMQPLSKPIRAFSGANALSFVKEFLALLNNTPLMYTCIQDTAASRLPSLCQSLCLLLELCRSLCVSP